MSDYTGSLAFIPYPLNYSNIGINTVYKMRAYSTNLSGYVSWDSPSAPDTEGRFSGLDKSDLSDITILGKENY